jgi:hypothetical protein
MGYQAITKVKVINPEILIILEADVLCVTEGGIHTSLVLNLRSWNIARNSIGPNMLFLFALRCLV